MTGNIKSWLISGGSMLAGVFCVVAIWWIVPQEDDKTVQNKQRFSQLSGQEQADLRNKARAFVDSTNHSELSRLQQIHVAVKSDPKLLGRLKSLDGLLANLDPETKAKLNPDGEFAEDWAQQVQVLTQDENAGDVKYVFTYPELSNWRVQKPDIVVNGYEYEAFLDRVSDKNWGENEEYQTFIDSEDRTTRRMFKTLTLMERSMQDESGELNRSILALAREMLVPEDLNKDERERKPEPSSNDSSDDEREKVRNEMRSIFTNHHALKLLDSGLRSITADFLSRCSAGKTVAPEVFTKNFKRSEQISLMTMAPADATQKLKTRLVEENNIQDPEIAKIHKILADAKTKTSEHSNKLMTQLRDVGRKLGGSMRSREGGRGGDGRGPRRPEDRGPNERGPGERNQGDRGLGGRGPGGPGGRGTGGPRFDDDRGANGPARTGPDNRSSDDPQRDNRRPNEDRPPAQSGKR